MDIAILIPCYNEAESIKKVVDDFHQVLKDARIYVYDNNSTDNSDLIAKEAGAIVCYEHRQGKGNVIRTMFRDIDADCYIMVDADDTYPASDAEKMVDLIINGNYDMVVGDRLSSTYFKENKRRFHNFGNVLVRNLVNGIFHGNIKDIMSGYRAFSPLFVKTFPILAKGFELETEMTIHALDKNLAIAQLPVEYKDRGGSVSKLNTFKDGFKVIWTIIKTFKDYRPLRFFNFLSIIVLLISAYLFMPVLIEYLNTGLVPRFPTLIVSCILAMMAILLFTCGLILDSIVRQDRKNFEIYLNLMKKRQNSKI